MASSPSRNTRHESEPTLTKVALSTRPRSHVVPALRDMPSDADANFAEDVQMDDAYFAALQQPGTEPVEHTHAHEQEESAEPLLETLEQVKRSMHLAVAVMLLGFVTFIMALFYLTHYPDKDIKAATWRLMSTTMSIFIAVLMFSSTQHILAVITGRHEGESEGGGEAESEHRHESTVAVGHDVVTSDILFWVFSRFFSFWIILQAYTYFVHGQARTLKTIAKLGSHIVAFAGMDAFGTLQENGVFSGSLLYCFLGLIVLGILIWLVFDIAEIGRSWIARRSSDPETRQEWLTECRAAEHEAAGLILGLLLSQCIRFAITGSLPPLEGGSPMGKSWWQVHMLFAIAIALALIVVPLEMVLTKLSALVEQRVEGSAALGSGEHSWNKGWTARIVRVIRETLSMAMAWCLMYWGRWAFWVSTGNSGLGYGDKMTALLTTSLFMSGFCCIGIILIDFVADRVVRGSGLAGLIALGNALGLVMGLSWESTFHEAVEGIGDLHLLPIGYTLNVLVLIFMLVAIVLPAWMLFIFPEALKAHKGDCHWTEENEF